MSSYLINSSQPTPSPPLMDSQMSLIPSMPSYSINMSSPSIKSSCTSSIFSSCGSLTTSSSFSSIPSPLPMDFQIDASLVPLIYIQSFTVITSFICSSCGFFIPLTFFNTFSPTNEFQKFL